MRKRLLAVLVASAAVLSSGFVAPDRAQAAAGPLDTPADLAAALTAEERILDHFHFGQIYEQLYNTPARVTGDIATTVGENDSALYTGNYLGAQAFRYALAKRKIAEGVDVPFWTAQRNEAKTRVDAMVKQYHLLINISKNWKTTFNLQLHQDKPLTLGRIDFGGGIFQGEKGLLFRACTPTTAAAEGKPYANLGRNPNYNRLVGPLRWDDGKFYNCFGATSRDAYAGTTFGLMTALDMVSGDDPAMRATIRDDLIAMTSFALKYLWSTPRPHGTVVIPEVEGGNDLDNFISPLFVYTQAAQLNMVSIARHAARVAGTAQQRNYWDAIYAAHAVVNGPLLPGSLLADVAQRHDSYYKYHLNYLTMFNLIRTEPTSSLWQPVYRLALSIQDASLRDDMNALYDAFVYALTGDQARLGQAVVHHRQWLDYKARLDANNNDTLNSPKCGVSIECVPKASTDMIIAGLPPILLPELPTPTGEVRARLPLPVKDRKGQDFMWQKDPTLLDEDQSPTWEPIGWDFLLPYWMIRYYSEAAQPANTPLPPWTAVIFR